jgi:hypothetical protein
MRITHGLLLKNAKQWVMERQATDRSLVCAYLSGSLADSDDAEDALIGGAGDVDVVCVHNSLNPPDRELVRLTDRIHLDIWPVSQSAYEDPKLLRMNPWLGHDLIRKPPVLFDKNHWFDFVLAGAFSKYDQPENVALRAMYFLNTARERLQAMAFGEVAPHAWLSAYLQTLSDGANMLAVMADGPLSTRRLLSTFPARAAELGIPQWTGRLIEAFSRGVPEGDTLAQWIRQWDDLFDSQVETTSIPPDLDPLKIPYYRHAMETFAPSAPMSALWILLFTLGQRLSISKETTPPPIIEMLQAVGLGEETREEREESLEALIDDAEGVLEDWAKNRGLPELVSLTNS